MTKPLKPSKTAVERTEKPAVLPDCILCGKCLEVCPLVRATGREELSPKAKHYLAQVLRDDPERLKGEAVSKLAALCMSCERCADACPKGLSGAEAMAGLRAEHPDLEQWLWKNWIRAGWLLWPTLSSLSRFAPHRMEREGRSRFSEAVRKLRALDERTGLAPWLEVVAYDRSREGEPVVVFPGCTAGNARTDWTDAALRMLGDVGAMGEQDRQAGLGMDIILSPDWTCCGATLGHAGVRTTQAAMRRHNVQQWREAGSPRIAVFCASCLHGLREYARPAGVDAQQEVDWRPGEADRWLSALTPLSTLWGNTEFRVLESAPETVLYHSPCHARVGGQTDADHGWLAGLLQDRLKGANTDRCCGMGGILQLAASELSTRVADECWSELVSNISDSPSNNSSPVSSAPGSFAQLLTGCSGCVLQLKTTAPANVQVGHWLEILL